MRAHALWKSGLCFSLSLLAVVLVSSVAESERSARPQIAPSEAPIPSEIRRLEPPPEPSPVELVTATMNAAARPAPPPSKRRMASSARSLRGTVPSRRFLPVIDQPDIEERHKILADTTLRLLPSGCDRQLKNFFVRYQKPKNRGLGGTTSIILDGTVGDEEFVALLVHECAHLAHANMSGNPASGDSGFHDGPQVFFNDSPIVAYFRLSWEADRVQRRGSADAHFLSRYARSDQYEDFAEAFTAYMLHREVFRVRAKEDAVVAAKLAWMQTYFPSPVLPTVSSRYAWNGKVPWDMTKQPFSWTPGVLRAQLEATTVAQRP